LHRAAAAWRKAGVKARGLSDGEEKEKLSSGMVFKKRWQRLGRLQNWKALWSSKGRKASELSSLSSDDGAMYISSKKEKVVQTDKLEEQKSRRRIGKGVLIREWAEELAKPTAHNNGVAACPFALPAYENREVKFIVSDDLWPDVLTESSRFFNTGYKVTMVFDYDYDYDYDQLEQECMALNRFFASAGIDIWLLSYLREHAIVFIQRWSELENAAAKLEKLGYYTNYDPQDYERHILGRRNRSI